MTMLQTVTTSEVKPTTRRLLGAHAGPTNWERHLELHGPTPVTASGAVGWRETVLAEIERSGLTGRGGAGFPTYRKARSVLAADSHPVVVVNAMEGEPASAKDRALVQSSPHLVLDGAQVLADVLLASRAVICVPDGGQPMAEWLSAALRERPAGRGKGWPVEIVRLPGRYLAGEESALLAAVAGRVGRPAFRPHKSVPLLVGRRHAVVHNVETVANVALIARYGAAWFRQVGTAEAPGTCLVTVSGDVGRPGVLEVEIGTPVRDILRRAGATGSVPAVLIGGYGGSWLAREDLATPYAPAALRTVGAAMGAGVLFALPAGACGTRETARIARYMAGESAGQCGPCLFGLPAIADDLQLIADGGGDHGTYDRLLQRCGWVAGRGACRHPDGVARLVRSGASVFARDLAAHLRGEPCSGSDWPTTLPFPHPDASRG
jgi:NADH:ubiquinone oxidoreductase subunit F (NADH-binding)